MGSLTSRPKSAASAVSPQVVYVPQTVVPVTSTPTQTTTPTGTETLPPPPSPAAVRTTGLLSRDRGRFGTIITGFKGLLDTITGQNAGRKTLLGE